MEEFVAFERLDRYEALFRQHVQKLSHEFAGQCVELGHLYGHYPFDLASRPAGHRPLRAPTPPATPTPTPTPTPETLNRV